MTRSEIAESLARNCVWACIPVDFEIPWSIQNFLKATGRAGTKDEIKEVSGRIRSAVLSELSSYPQIKQEESK